MPKLHLLTPSQVANAKPQAKPYKLADGGGLYLLVKPNGAKLWRFKYRRPIERRENLLSFGQHPDVSVKAAREKHRGARALLADGIDPGEQRRADDERRSAAAANSFEAVAREWLAVRAHEWVPAHLDKETLRLTKHAFPWIGGRPVSELGVDEIRPLITRIFKGGHLENAHRLRDQLSRIFRYAIATERAKRDPAADLAQVLPARQKKKRVAIVDPEEIAELLRAVNSFTGTFPVACALRLAPYLMARAGEIRMAEWAHVELDGEHPQYCVPPANRKLKRARKEDPDTLPHTIPLSRQAVTILRELRPLTGHRRYLFPGGRDPNRCMSDAAINAALARIGYKGRMTGHGFRKTAKTRLQEMGWPRDLVEAQLSHEVGGTEGAYWLEQEKRQIADRRKMLQQWADFLDTLRDGTGKVTPIHRRTVA